MAMMIMMKPRNRSTDSTRTRFIPAGKGTADISGLVMTDIRRSLAKNGSGGSSKKDRDCVLCRASHQSGRRVRPTDSRGRPSRHGLLRQHDSPLRLGLVYNSSLLVFV